MNFNLSEMLDEAKKSLIKGAAAYFVCALIARIFGPKPSHVEIEEGVSAEICTVGRKGDPKIVYVSSKKQRLNLFPAILMLGAAFGISAAQKEIDDTVISRFDS